MTIFRLDMSGGAELQIGWSLELKPIEEAPALELISILDEQSIPVPRLEEIVPEGEVA